MRFIYNELLWFNLNNNNNNNNKSYHTLLLQNRMTTIMMIYLLLKEKNAYISGTCIWSHRHLVPIKNAPVV